MKVSSFLLNDFKIKKKKFVEKSIINGKFVIKNEKENIFFSFFNKLFKDKVWKIFRGTVSNKILTHFFILIFFKNSFKEI